MDKKYYYREKNVLDIKVHEMIVRLWSATGVNDRDEILKMLTPLAKAGFVSPYMALMPDWHLGADAIVGSVVPTKDVLLPNVIGGDIGCGLTAVRLPVLATELSADFEVIAAELSENIPAGSAHNATVPERVSANPLWERELKAPVSNRTLRKLMRQFGSIGGGNHFLELQRDHEDHLWIMLHSGSRYLGVEIRDYYVAEGAKRDGIDEKLYKRIPYLVASDPFSGDYLADVQSVKDFARESRREILTRALEVMQKHVPSLDVGDLLQGASDVSHNYVQGEEHFGEQLYVHRKGAIRLAEGEIGFVPGSMGTASFVVEGRGNGYAFCSSAHGAGRAMSRAAAARLISRQELCENMEGIVCAHDALLVDEAPGAYKDIRVVMRGQRDLVKILYELSPVVSIKGR